MIQILEYYRPLLCTYGVYPNRARWYLVICSKYLEAELINYQLYFLTSNKHLRRYSVSAWFNSKLVERSPEVVP